ncbi:MAG: type II toxin-antitoxin system HicA family toxin [Desulfobacterium sp.]|nr:type II toxin-antitoxin system HicA family toxin [Desulfobacterium sp.]
MIMNGRQVLKILNENGWQILRINGSHHRLGKGHLKISVPVHGKRDLGVGLIKAIEKQTGVKLT